MVFALKTTAQRRALPRRTLLEVSQTGSSLFHNVNYSVSSTPQSNRQVFPSMVHFCAIYYSRIWIPFRRLYLRHREGGFCKVTSCPSCGKELPNKEKASMHLIKEHAKTGYSKKQLMKFLKQIEEGKGSPK